MSVTHATLHHVCGEIAAGKSTLTARLGQEPGTLVVAEDHWRACSGGTPRARTTSR